MIIGICGKSGCGKSTLANQINMTAYEAGILARKSNAQKLLLTHF